jgi:hypothetical protein
MLGHARFMLTLMQQGDDAMNSGLCTFQDAVGAHAGYQEKALLRAAMAATVAKAPAYYFRGCITSFAAP